MYDNFIEKTSKNELLALSIMIYIFINAKYV